MPTEGYTLVQLIQRVREVLPPKLNLFDQETSGPQGYTAADMIARVRSVLRDADPTDANRFIQDADILQWLNEAILDLGIRTRSIRKSASISLTAGVGPLPTDFIDFESIFYAGSYADKVSDEEEWKDWVDSGVAPPRPIWHIEEANLKVYPSVTASATVHYVGRPYVFTGPTDATLTTLPLELQVRAINYGRAHGCWKEMEFFLGDRYMQLYQGGLPPGEEDVPSELRQQQVRDPHKIADYMITDWLNEALIDLAAREDLVQVESTGSVTIAGADATIPMPSGFLRSKELRISAAGNDGQVTVEFNPEAFLYYKFNSSGLIPSHYLGRTFGDIIELYPVPPAGTTFTLRSIMRATLLVVFTDKPNIPQEMQVKAINYARAQALYASPTGPQDLATADRYMGLYRDHLRSYSPNERTIQGPIQLIPFPGPFDTSDAHHV